MRYLLVIFCVVLAVSVQAQSKVIYFKGDTAAAVSKPASTDTEAWSQHIFSKTQLDSVASSKIPDGSYEVIISFVVSKNGEISKVKVVKDAGYGLGKIAAEIIRSYKGKWQPATEDGKPVAAGYRQPIVFVIDTEK